MTFTRCEQQISLKIFNQAASTRYSGNNKEKLSTNVRSDYASDVSAMEIHLKETFSDNFFISVFCSKDDKIDMFMRTVSCQTTTIITEQY